MNIFQVSSYLREAEASLRPILVLLSEFSRGYQLTWGRTRNFDFRPKFVFFSKILLLFLDLYTLYVNCARLVVNQSLSYLRYTNFDVLKSANYFAHLMFKHPVLLVTINKLCFKSRGHSHSHFCPYFMFILASTFNNFQ